MDKGQKKKKKKREVKREDAEECGNKIQVNEEQRMGR